VTQKANEKILIIPSYNELENLIELCKEINEKLNTWDVLIVDDGSTDGTSDWLIKEGISHLRLPFNTGIGGAMHAGYAWAEKMGYVYTLQMDGDGQHPPKEADKLLAEMQKDKDTDLVIGSRFLKEGDYEQEFARIIGIKIFRLIIRVLTGKNIFDPTSGFRLANKRTTKRFADDYPSDYPEVDSLFQLLFLNYKVKEIPVKMKKRKYGKTSVHSWVSVIYMIKVPFSIFLDYREIRRGGRDVSD